MSITVIRYTGWPKKASQTLRTITARMLYGEKFAFAHL